MQKTIDTKPWYCQFWPWLIIALPATVVVAGISMIRLAHHSADDMVVDNYYKDGKAINQSLGQDQRAVELNMVAELSFNFDSGQLIVSLAGDELPQNLVLHLYHPIEADHDTTVLLTPRGEGRYLGELSQRLQHRYLLRLLPANESDAAAGLQQDGSQVPPQWRLNGEIDFERSQGAVLVANPQ